MNPLKQIIIEKIRRECPISFETFMDMALYHPEFGYYTKRSTKIGRTGDFYTSPHLHPVFGAIIGRQMKEMWEVMDKPDNFQIVEMGAGMGYMAKDILEYLEGFKGSRVQGFKSQRIRREKGIFSHIKYTLVEQNPYLKTAQQELLKDFSDKTRWISALNELEPATGCFLSNELLDAFPVRIVEMHNELTEIYVSVNEDTLIELRMPCITEIKNYFKEFSIELSENFRTEVNLKIHDWLKDVTNRLTEGFVLTIDYGYPAEDYYSEDRNKGTLLCYHQHQANENPYQNIGEQDITSHVNFSALKKWGEGFGLKTIGFCPQGTFLVALGIDEVITENVIARSSKIDRNDEAISETHSDQGKRNEIASPLARNDTRNLLNTNYIFETAKIKGLILPETMGESHKIMVHYKGTGHPKLRGFSIRNQAGIL